MYVLYYVISYYIISSYIILYYITICYILLNHIALSLYIILHCIIWRYIICNFKFKSSVVNNLDGTLIKEANMKARQKLQCGFCWLTYHTADTVKLSVYITTINNESQLIVNSRVSHRVPLKLGGHLQLYVRPFSEHVPPFLQGLLMQCRPVITY